MQCSCSSQFYAVPYSFQSTLFTTWNTLKLRTEITYWCSQWRTSEVIGYGESRIRVFRQRDYERWSELIPFLEWIVNQGSRRWNLSFNSCCLLVRVAKLLCEYFPLSRYVDQYRDRQKDWRETRWKRLSLLLGGSGSDQRPTKSLFMHDPYSWVDDSWNMSLLRAV